MAKTDPVAPQVRSYDRRSSADDARIAVFLRQMYHLLLDQVRPRAWSQVLSVECGDGWVAEEAWRRLGRGYVCGIDLSPAMTDQAQRLRGVQGRLEFRCWDGEALPFQAATFDCVLTTFALYRYSDPTSVLRELGRVLRPDGEIYLLEPDRTSFAGLYRLWDYFFRLTDPGHYRYYSSNEMLHMLAEAGFVGTAELKRHEEVVMGGKLLASAVVLGARRS